MATGTYLLRIWMTGFNTDRSKEVLEELGRTYSGVGISQRKAILRKVNEGERVVVYQTNSRNDAQIVAGRLARAGVEVEVDG